MIARRRPRRREGPVNRNPPTLILFEFLVKLWGGVCEICGDVHRLEFAHIRPTRLKGRSRGSRHRYLDVDAGLIPVHIPDPDVLEVDPLPSYLTPQRVAQLAGAADLGISNGGGRHAGCEHAGVSIAGSVSCDTSTSKPGDPRSPGFAPLSGDGVGMRGDMASTAASLPGSTKKRSIAC